MTTTSSQLGLADFIAQHFDKNIVHRAQTPRATAVTEPISARLHKDVVGLLAEHGIDSLYSFQNQAVELLLDGTHIALAGGTGSGKSLCYQLPILDSLARSGRARALYLAPTKALAEDQARRLRELNTPWLEVGRYDGDTPQRARAHIRKNANFLLTNPDMLSAALLPRHEEWAGFFANVKFVVVDESHVYRGVFGSHVACVLRRLLRVCRSYGNDSCTFVTASGTIANATEHACKLIALPSAAFVGDYGAPQAPRDLLLWNTEGDQETGERDSALGDGSRLFAELLKANTPTIVFARTRKGCELIHTFTRDRLIADGREDLAKRIQPYRAGYTPVERRRIERNLAAGNLLGVVATNALELGIDIGRLAASVCVGFPGTTTSLRQQWGRAGRGHERAVCCLIASEDALDQFLVTHPQTTLDAPLEHAVIDPTNARILSQHLLAAACELPLRDAESELFGDTYPALIDELADMGSLRRTGSGAVYCGVDHPASQISLRTAGKSRVTIVEQSTGSILGTTERERAHLSVYPGAVYLHRGTSYHVSALDFNTGIALVDEQAMPYYTLPKTDTAISIVRVVRQRTLSDGTQLFFGAIEVHEQSVGYQKRSASTHHVLDLVHQQLPRISYMTEAVWFLPRDESLAALDNERLLGALHAAEHAMIAMLPLLAMCDRNDIGGLSTNFHDQTESETIFVYDGHDGGIGITALAEARFETWTALTQKMLEACPCESGCPSCVQSPKCGNLNEPLDKLGALAILSALPEPAEVS